MAYTTGQGTAATVTAIQSANSAAQFDAVNNALSSLAQANVTPIGSPVLLWGVLVKCTTGYGSTAGGTTPVFAYDASPA
jgi:hypothetical protein